VIFNVEMLPALHGDCIWIEYGDATVPQRLLIDGGPVDAYDALAQRVARVPAAQRRLELLVVTHIDNDHIEGILKLLNHPETGLTFDDLWFNGRPQIERALPDAPPLPGRPGERGAVQAEVLMRRLVASGKTDWNGWFGGLAIHVPVPGAGAPLPCAELGGGLKVTVLGPTPDRLMKLRDAWDEALEGREDAVQKLDDAERYRGGAERPETAWMDISLLGSRLDDSAANGSSIALLAEYGGKRCALLGDAFAPDIEKSLRLLADERGEKRLRLDALKLSHHGSDANLTDRLLDAIDCDTFLVSSDGIRHDHPGKQTVKRIVERVRARGVTPRLVFNYRSGAAARWEALQQDGGFTADYPDAGAAGKVVRLLG